MLSISSLGHTTLNTPPVPAHALPLQALDFTHPFRVSGIAVPKPRSLTSHPSAFQSLSRDNHSAVVFVGRSLFLVLQRRGGRSEHEIGQFETQLWQSRKLRPRFMFWLQTTGRRFWTGRWFIFFKCVSFYQISSLHPGIPHL